MNLKKVSLLLSVALYATGVASAGAATATAVAHAHTAPVKQKAKPHAKAKSKKATKHKKKKLTKQLQAAKKQKDSMTFGGASGLVPKIDPQNGQLSMSFPLGVLQGNGDSPKLSLSYSSSSQSNLDNLGIGWSFNVTSYNSTTDYLYLGNGAAYRVNIYNGEASWENGQKPEGVVFTTAGASAKPLPPIPGSKATRTYDYTLALHDGSIEYLKNFSASSGTVARVIAVKDRVGNLTNYTYNNFGELTSIISNSGNVMTVSGYPSNVTITMPKDFYGHAKTVKLTKNSQQALEHLVVSATGSSDTFTYTLSAHGSGSNMVNTIQYPSGMTAYIYHNNQMKICTVAQCGSNPQETQTEPLYGEIRYENAAGQTIQVEKVNSQVDDHDFTSDESSGEVHNYTGYPKFSPSNTADLLMHGPGSSSPGYTYTVSTTKGDTTTYSTYNHLHQLIAQDVYDTKLANSNFSKGSPGTLARASFRYADAKGKQADPINGLLMSNFSLNDYNKPVLSTAQTFQLQSNQLAGGPVISMASQYNAYGEVLQQDDKKEQVKVVSTYDDAHGGLLEQKVMYPELVFKPVESDLLKDQAGSDAMGYPQYTKNNIGVIIPASESKTGKDVYGIVSTTTGYLKNGTLQSATPVYQTVLNYDNTGRIKTKTMQFSDAANADKSLQLGNVSSSGSVTTYLDSVTQASQVSSMFLPGQCPAALQANPDAVRVNVSENVGTAMVGGKSTDSSRQSAVISDKVTGKPLYQLSGYNPTTKQYSYVTSYVYDGFGRTVSKTTPDQQTVHYAYTVGNSNNSVTETLPNGDQQKKMFDDFGHLHYEELLNSGASQAILMKQNTYDYNQPQQDQSSYGLLESSIDQAGNKTQLFYNDQQQKMAELTQSQSPSGLAANSPMVTLSFYGHSLADRANSRQISYKSYGEAGKAQSVDFYQVTQMDPHMPSVKLATYTLRAGTYGLPTTSTVPTAGVSENNPDTAAIIAGVTQALAQKGWVSHTTFTYNNYKKQLSKTIDVGYDSNGKVQTYTSHRHYDPINQLTETDDLDPNNASLHDPERDGDQDLISESYQYNLLGKTINKKLVPSSSTTSLVNSSPYYRQEHTTYDGLGDIESVGFSGADNSGTVTAETVYADPVFDSLGRVLSYTYLGITKGAHLDKTPYTYHTNYDAMGRKVASWVTNVSNQLPLYDPSDKSRGSLWPICRIYNPKTGQLSDIYYDTTATSGNAAKYCDATFGQAPAATSTNMLIHYNYDGLTGKMLAEVYPPATKGGKSRSISYKYYEPAAPTPSNVD